MAHSWRKNFGCAAGRVVWDEHPNAHPILKTGLAAGFHGRPAPSNTKPDVPERRSADTTFLLSLTPAGVKAMQQNYRHPLQEL